MVSCDRRLEGWEFQALPPWHKRLDVKRVSRDFVGINRGQIPWPRYHVILSASALELVSMLHRGHDCQMSPKHTRKKLEAAMQSHLHHSAQELNSSNDHTFYAASLSQLGFK